MELVKLMHDGYPNRCQFHEMLRFRGGSRAVCGGISKVSGILFLSFRLPELGTKGVCVWSGKGRHFMHGWIDDCGQQVSVPKPQTGPFPNLGG